MINPIHFSSSVHLHAHCTLGGSPTQLVELPLLVTTNTTDGSSTAHNSAPFDDVTRENNFVTNSFVNADDARLDTMTSVRSIVVGLK